MKLKEVEPRENRLKHASESWNECQCNIGAQDGCSLCRRFRRRRRRRRPVVVSSRGSSSSMFY